MKQSSYNHGHEWERLPRRISNWVGQQDQWGAKPNSDLCHLEGSSPIVVTTRVCLMLRVKTDWMMFIQRSQQRPNQHKQSYCTYCKRKLLLWIWGDIYRETLPRTWPSGFLYLLQKWRCGQRKAVQAWNSFYWRNPRREWSLTLSLVRTRKRLVQTAKFQCEASI